MAKTIEVIARGLLVHRGRVLLCRHRRKGYSYLPGGHVEFGESAPQALRREFLEECGQEVRVGRLCQVSEGMFKQSGTRRHEVNLVFHVKPIGQLRTTSLENDIDFHWVRWADISATDIRPDSAIALLQERARRMTFHSIDQ